MDSLIKIEQRGIEVRRDEPMGRHTGFQTGGSARAYIQPQDRSLFLDTLTFLREENEPFLLLGKGSNLFVSQRGYGGIVVSTERALSTITCKSNQTVVCEAGVSLFRLCRFAQAEGLSGLEFAFGIPGTLGGAVYMNAGAYGGEMQDIVLSVDALDLEGNLRHFSKEELEFSYRNSVFQKNPYTILQATLQLVCDHPRDIQSRMDTYIQKRKDKQPLEYPSAGSTFKRPQGQYAGALIEQCGLKGYRLGGAQVSEKHAGFIINRDHATAAEIEQLIRYVQQVVLEKTGFSLECEVQIL